jgi:hypothetical protein
VRLHHKKAKVVVSGSGVVPQSDGFLKMPNGQTHLTGSRFRSRQIIVIVGSRGALNQLQKCLLGARKVLGMECPETTLQ